MERSRSCDLPHVPCSSESACAGVKRGSFLFIPTFLLGMIYQFAWHQAPHSLSQSDGQLANPFVRSGAPLPIRRSGMERVRASAQISGPPGSGGYCANATGRGRRQGPFDRHRAIGHSIFCQGPCRGILRTRVRSGGGSVWPLPRTPPRNAPLPRGQA